MKVTNNADALEGVDSGAKEQRQLAPGGESADSRGARQTLQHVEERDAETRGGEQGGEQRHRRQIFEIVDPVHQHHRE